MSIRNVHVLADEARNAWLDAIRAAEDSPSVEAFDERDRKHGVWARCADERDAAVDALIGAFADYWPGIQTTEQYDVLLAAALACHATDTEDGHAEH